MNIDKAKKRIAKQVKKGFKGYPQISIAYFGDTPNMANLVVVEFTAEDCGEVQTERFSSKVDAREDETIQTSLIKIIERANVNTVLEADGVGLTKDAN
jgi:hypothetical protein